MMKSAQAKLTPGSHEPEDSQRMPFQDRAAGHGSFFSWTTHAVSSSHIGWVLGFKPKTDACASAPFHEGGGEIRELEGSREEVETEEEEAGAGKEWGKEEEEQLKTCISTSTRAINHR